MRNLNDKQLMEIVNNFQWQVAGNFAATSCDWLWLGPSSLCIKNQRRAQQMASFICVFCAMLAVLPPAVGVSSWRNPDLRSPRPPSQGTAHASPSPAPDAACEKFALTSYKLLSLSIDDTRFPYTNRTQLARSVEEDMKPTIFVFDAIINSIFT